MGVGAELGPGSVGKGFIEPDRAGDELEIGSFGMVHLLNSAALAEKRIIERLSDVIHGRAGGRSANFGQNSPYPVESRLRRTSWGKAQLRL